MANPPERRTASIGIRTWPSLKDAIDAMALEDGRTTARYVELLIIAAAEARGRWPKPIG